MTEPVLNLYDKVVYPCGVFNPNCTICDLQEGVCDPIRQERGKLRYIPCEDEAVGQQSKPGLCEICDFQSRCTEMSWQIFLKGEEKT